MTYIKLKTASDNYNYIRKVKKRHNGQVDIFLSKAEDKKFFNYSLNSLKRYISYLDTAGVPYELENEMDIIKL